MKHIKRINELFNPEEDRIYIVIKDNHLLGGFTSDLKAKECVDTHINNMLNTYSVKNITDIDAYKDELRLKYIIKSVLVDRMYDNLDI